MRTRLRPALSANSIRQEVDTYDVFWKVPAIGDGHASQPFTSNCRRLAPTSRRPSGLSFPAELTPNSGASICQGGFERLHHTDHWTHRYAHRRTRSHRSAAMARLRSTRLTSSSSVVRRWEAAPHALEVARTYLKVLQASNTFSPGWITFFFSSPALLLLVTGVRRLLLTVSAFTLSHTVTLTLASLGFVHLSRACSGRGSYCV